MSRYLFLPAITLSLLLAGGCGPAGPRTYPVTGAVTFDGKPLADGDIIFLPEDAQFGPDAGKIEEGKFSFQAKAGKQKVKISASKLEPGLGAMGETEVYKSYIPEKYNTKTELSAEVTPGGNNHFEFTLKSE